jgi:hypothetical protein
VRGRRREVNPVLGVERGVDATGVEVRVDQPRGRRRFVLDGSRPQKDPADRYSRLPPVAAIGGVEAMTLLRTLMVSGAV